MTTVTPVEIVPPHGSKRSSCATDQGTSLNGHTVVVLRRQERKGQAMARKPNYKFERMERERAKAEKKAARAKAKAERAAKREEQQPEDAPAAEEDSLRSA